MNKTELSAFPDHSGNFSGSYSDKADFTHKLLFYKKNIVGCLFGKKPPAPTMVTIQYIK
jgi:hypothetical protein